MDSEERHKNTGLLWAFTLWLEKEGPRASVPFIGGLLLGCHVTSQIPLKLSRVYRALLPVTSIPLGVVNWRGTRSQHVLQCGTRTAGGT